MTGISARAVLLPAPAILACVTGSCPNTSRTSCRRRRARIESLRAQLLELFRVHGYELVMPPLLEYLESLLTGTGHDMDLRTFKLVDQLSGRTMGVRADITPQVARIDAHLLNREGVTRLCYCGSVLHTLPAGLTSTREPLQIGAEIYGHGGIESDLEIQRLLGQALKLCKLSGVRLDIGHVAVFRELAQRGGIGPELEADLFAALQAKDASALRALTKRLDKATRNAILLLPELYGGREVIARARRELPKYAGIARALADLQALTATQDIPGEHRSGRSARLSLSQRRRFRRVLRPLAQCDRARRALRRRGQGFRPRPAGDRFHPVSAGLARLAPAAPAPGCIRAPRASDPALDAAMASLRRAGEVVIQDLPGHENEGEEGRCGRELIKRKGKWQVKKI